ncbi:MAG: tetratricopeptide repeat protein [Cyanobacteria bacterium P01_G01_bin.67]
MNLKRARSTPKSISLESKSAKEHYELGNVLREQGQTKEAIACYQSAISLEPKFARAHNNLGNLLKQQGQTTEAISCYQTAISLEPELVTMHLNLGDILKEQGQTTEAIASYQRALEIDPDCYEAKLGKALAQLPIIYETEAEIKLARSNYQDHLQSLAAELRAASKSERIKAEVVVGSHLPFYLAYQGLGDRDLQSTYGSLMHQLMASRYPQWTQPLPLPDLNQNQKIRIGFVCGFFYRHSVWKIPLQGWLENLDRSEFELFGYYIGTIRDEATVQAAKNFERFVEDSLTVEQWAAQIIQDDLHIIIFPEFGMNPLSYKLGCLRLAPVQITSWGHPDTSGLPTIDYYLSSELMEPENAQENYTEELVKLPNLGMCYQPVLIEPQIISKSDLGIHDSDIMFWCCQSLFKYLPQHDDIFPRIAQELDNAKFVFIELTSKFATNIFRQRLANIFKQFNLDYQNYCIFLPRLNGSAFVGITAIADVFLDNIGWSGCNTTLEAIPHSIPIVTLPDNFMRGRHTLGFLKMLGMEETIAQDKDEYVQIAVGLGQDADYRRHLAQQIAHNQHQLYGDLSPVRALEDFLLQTLNKSRRIADPKVGQAFQLALKYQRANQLAAARQEYLRVITAYPQHAEALSGLGIIAQQMNRLEDAEQYLSASVAAQPTFLQSWFSLGNLRQSQGQYQGAEVAYRQALELRPNSVPICNNLGYVLQQQDKWSAATSYYKRALEIDPKCVAAEVNLGNALYAQGKLSQEKQIHYAQLNYKLGLSRHQVQDWQTAITYYRQAILMHPDMVDAHYHLGWTLHKQRQLAEAQACYQQVLQLDPDCGAVYYNLGKIAQDLGDLDQATVNFRQGLKFINARYGEVTSALANNSFANNFEIPNIPQGEVTIGDYQFPAIPTLAKSQGKRPFWSVVIPVVNRPEYFPECLASVLAQWTEGEMEIIVLDNGSDPPQWQIPHSLGQGIIRYYRFPETIPLQENWNTAVSLCRGQWIHLLHHDDYVLPGFYARLQAGLENCPESVGAAFTGYENINEKREVIFSQQHNLGNHRGIVADWLFRIGVSCTLSPPSLVIRRAAYEKLGGYKLNLLYTCDWEFYKRVATFYDWWYEPGILAHYREQANSITIAENMNGSSGEAHRHAIEIAASYLPSKHQAEITAKSLAFHFDWCLHQAHIPLSAGNLEGATCLLEEALKMDQSPAAISKLSRWLKQKPAYNLLNQLAAAELESEVNILVNLSRRLLKEEHRAVSPEIP